jgi:hypothetical protein
MLPAGQGSKKGAQESAAPFLSTLEFNYLVTNILPVAEC